MRGFYTAVFISLVGYGFQGVHSLPTANAAVAVVGTGKAETISRSVSAETLGAFTLAERENFGLENREVTVGTLIGDAINLGIAIFNFARDGLEFWGKHFKEGDYSSTCEFVGSSSYYSGSCPQRRSAANYGDEIQSHFENVQSLASSIVNSLSVLDPNTADPGTTRATLQTAYDQTQQILSSYFSVSSLTSSYDTPKADSALDRSIDHTNQSADKISRALSMV